MTSRLRFCLLAACSCALSVCAGISAAAPAPALPRVTLIGDSVPDVIQSTPEARATLSNGIDLNIQTVPCRKVDEAGCAYKDSHPPSVTELVEELGTELGPTVIVSVGYNDDPARYAAAVEDALGALQAVGVSRVIWATLKVDRTTYAAMNAVLRAAAVRHPELSVADWNAAAQPHPEWFQPDGLHPNAAGTTAMARVFHKSLVDLGVAVVSPPLRVTTRSLPAGHVGGSYRTRMAAAGGTPPYRWSLTAQAPKGLHLAPTGTITGVPLVRTARAVTLRVTDVLGASRTVSLPLRISAAAR